MGMVLTVSQEAAGFPDWGKVQFIDFPVKSWSTLLPCTTDVEQDFVAQLVRYESGDRLSAVKVSLTIQYARVCKLKLTGP